jgi:coproporphyrinogen III oxidase
MHFPAQKIGKSLKIIVESPFLNEHVVDFAKSIPVQYNVKIEKKKKLTKEWFIKLQNIICNNVEQLEKEYGSNIKFKRNKWKYGEFRTIRGKVVEKGGVAFSNVIGKFPKEFAKTIPGTKNNTYFWSSGVSVVFHPKNPKVPAMHFNTRFICTQKRWFERWYGCNTLPCRC